MLTIKVYHFLQIFKTFQAAPAVVKYRHSYFPPTMSSLIEPILLNMNQIALERTTYTSLHLRFRPTSNQSIR